MRSSTDKIFAHFGQFFALLPLPPSCSLKTHRIRILKKLQKTLEISSFYTSAAQMTIIMWYMVPDISTATDNFFCHLGPSWPIHSLTAQKSKILKRWRKIVEISSFYTIVPKSMIIGYTVRDTWHVTDVIVIFHFGLFFALLPLSSPYRSWHMARDRCNCYFSLWTIFFPFTPITTQKTKISKTMKRKHLEI